MRQNTQEHLKACSSIIQRMILLDGRPLAEHVLWAELFFLLILQ